MEVLVNSKHAEDNLMDGQIMGRGLYFIFAAFVVDPHHPDNIIRNICSAAYGALYASIFKL